MGVGPSWHLGLTDEENTPNPLRVLKDPTPRARHQGLSACFSQTLSPSHLRGPHPGWAKHRVTKDALPLTSPRAPPPLAREVNPRLAMLALRWNPLLSVSSASLLRPQGRPAQIHPLMIVCLAPEKAPPSDSRQPGKCGQSGPSGGIQLTESEAGAPPVPPHIPEVPRCSSPPITGFQGTCSPRVDPSWDSPPGIPSRLSRQSHISCPEPCPSKGQRPQCPEQEKRAREAPKPTGMDGEEVQ